MSRDELVALLERERISYPDEVEGERYQPGGVERVAGRPARYTPITEERAEQNYRRLARALNEQDND
jgi:hypothetical protein